MVGRQNVILADDHLSSAAAFAMLLERRLPVHVLTVHSHAGSALAQVQAHAADPELPQISLVLLDIEMPGLDPFLALRRIKMASPEIRVAFRTAFPRDKFIDRALEADADGFLCKDEDQTSTEFALRAILSGAEYYSPPVERRIVTERGERHSRLSKLSERELETLRHYASGLEKEEIAQRMKLSIRSVSNYLSKISEKLDLHGAVALVRFAYEEGLICL